MSSDSENRAREDPCGIDSYPAAVSSKHVERQERGDPCSSKTSEEQLLSKPTRNPKPEKNENHDQERETRVMVDCFVRELEQRVSDLLDITNRWRGS